MPGTILKELHAFNLIKNPKKQMFYYFPTYR